MAKFPFMNGFLDPVTAQTYVKHVHASTETVGLLVGHSKG